jgi:hypothetical protein
MGTLVSLIIQLIGGGAGGNIVAALLKNLNLDKVLATITGVVGGVAGGQLASWMGILKQVMDAMGGSTGGEIAGHAGASAIGGALLTAIVGFIKKAMAAKAP